MVWPGILNKPIGDFEFRWWRTSMEGAPYFTTLSIRINTHSRVIPTTRRVCFGLRIICIGLCIFPSLSKENEERRTHRIKTFPAVVVANYFVQKGIDEKRPIDNLKVNKLVFSGTRLASRFQWRAVDSGASRGVAIRPCRPKRL